MYGTSELMVKSRKRQKLVLVREPNGRASRSAEDKEYAPARVKRLLDAALAEMGDPEWGTAIGRLYIRQKITAPMYAAGKRWVERADKYHHAIGAPPPNPKALSFEGHQHGNPPDPDSEEGKKHAKRDIDAVTDFLAAHAVLIAAGMLAEAMVRNTCERDIQPDDYEQLLALNRGLLWLADYWGLTNQRK